MRGAYYDNDQYITTQVRMIQSDAVLRPVAARFKLLEREGRLEGQTPEKRVAIEKAPVTLRHLRVTRPPNTYLIQVAYRSTDPELAANVTNSISKSYLEHIYNLQTRMNKTAEGFMQDQMEELKAKVERSSSALQAVETQLGMVNPEDKSSVLSARLLQMNTEYTNAQADRVKREAVFNATRGGTVESAQNSEQGKDLIRLDERLKEARQRLAEVKTTYGANHPEFRRASTNVTELQRQFEDARKNIVDRVEVDYKQALNREQMLQKAVGETKAEFDRLSSRSVEYQRLKREADADKKLYDELLKKIRERGINAGFQNNTTRLSDEARAPALPVSPNLMLNLALALVLSTFLSIGAAIMADVLDTTIRDPEQAARFLRTDVVGTLPAVKNATGAGLLALSPAAESTDGAGLVKFNEKAGYGYGYKSISSYEEAIRTLRNTILLSDIERNIRSLLVTSASPGEGKSTTAVHLAIAHAQQGKKTLVIDADLRRPTVHKKLNMDPTEGLSSVLMGKVAWKDACYEVPNYPNLFVLPSGPPSRRASDLIGPVMGELLDQAIRDFDLIVLDAPPLLGFAEPLQIATIADAVVVVTRAGETKRKAVQNVLGTLHRLHANVVGIVLNQVKREMSDHYYYYGHYRKYYGQDAEKAS
jgi:capsular exopolysaccharide synthesis family protein